MAPWVVRNGRVMGWYTLNTQIGTNMWIASNPDATGGYMALPPLPGGIETGDVSESEYNRLALEAAIDSIVADPIRSIELIPAKVFHLWAGHRHSVKFSLNNSNTKIPKLVRTMLPVWTQSFLYALAGFTILSFLKIPGPRFWLTFPANTVPISLLLWTLFHIPLFGAGRFHVPIEVALIIATSVAAGEIIKMFTRPSSEREPASSRS